MNCYYTLGYSTTNHITDYNICLATIYTSQQYGFWYTTNQITDYNYIASHTKYYVIEWNKVPLLTYIWYTNNQTNLITDYDIHLDYDL